MEWASIKDNGKEDIKKYMEEQGYASLNFQYDFIFARRHHRSDNNDITSV